MMVSKDKCKEALSNLSAILATRHCDKELTKEHIKVLDELITEHFNNPPLKIDELKEYEWVWDNRGKRWIELYWDEIDKKFEYYETGSEGEHSFGFEENRYYRKQVEE